MWNGCTLEQCTLPAFRWCKAQLCKWVPEFVSHLGWKSVPSPWNNNTNIYISLNSADHFHFLTGITGWERRSTSHVSHVLLAVLLTDTGAQPWLTMSGVKYNQVSEVIGACLDGRTALVALARQGHDELPLRSYFLKTVLIVARTWPFTGTARESTQHTRSGDAVETGMKNAIRKYWKEGNCRERVAG